MIYTKQLLHCILPMLLYFAWALAPAVIWSKTTQFVSSFRGRSLRRSESRKTIALVQHWCMDRRVAIRQLWCDLMDLWKSLWKDKQRHGSPWNVITNGFHCSSLACFVLNGILVWILWAFLVHQNCFSAFVCTFNHPFLTARHSVAVRTLLWVFGTVFVVCLLRPFRML